MPPSESVRGQRHDETLPEREAAALERRGRRPAPERARRMRSFHAPYHWHTTHPDTGLEVVFTPGEALPPWAITGRLDELIGPSGYTRPAAAHGAPSAPDSGQEG